MQNKLQIAVTALEKIIAEGISGDSLVVIAAIALHEIRREESNLTKEESNDK